MGDTLTSRGIYGSHLDFPVTCVASAEVRLTRRKTCVECADETITAEAAQPAIGAPNTLSVPETDHSLGMLVSPGGGAEIPGDSPG